MKRKCSHTRYHGRHSRRRRRRKRRSRRRRRKSHRRRSRRRRNARLNMTRKGRRRRQRGGGETPRFFCEQKVGWKKGAGKVVAHSIPETELIQNPQDYAAGYAAPAAGEGIVVPLHAATIPYLFKQNNINVEEVDFGVEVEWKSSTTPSAFRFKGKKVWNYFVIEPTGGGPWKIERGMMGRVLLFKEDELGMRMMLTRSFASTKEEDEWNRRRRAFWTTPAPGPYQKKAEARAAKAGLAIIPEQ